jgi:hypothetical protein
LKAVPRYGPMFERHACSIGDVKAELALPFGKRTWTQFAINGFDLKKNHLPVLGADFLKDADVPVGDQLMRIARKRVRGLLDEECVRIPDEMWKWGAEAVKASQIYFTLKRGGAPTRHKREAIANFFANVPVGSKSDFAKIIWENYEAGRHPNDNSYKAECRAFIEELWKVVEANP